MRLIHVLRMSLVVAAMLLTSDPSAQVLRVEEWLEDPADVTIDVEQDPASTPLRLDGITQEDDLFDNQAGSENILLFLSGLRWGCFNAATNAGIDHHIQTTRNADLFGVNTQRNTRIEFNSHSVPANFPATYDETTASYVYTIFSEADPGANIPPVVDMTSGRFKVAAQNNFNAGATGTFNIRLLMQTEGSKWYRSNDLTANNVSNGTIAASGSVWMDENSENVTTAAREAIMDSYEITGITWERVSAAAETDMNEFDDAGSVALGATQSDPGPDLTQVTGMGFVAVQLATGLTSFGTSQDITLLALIAEGEEPPPPGPVAIFTETWDSVTPLPFSFGNAILIAGSDENFVTGPDSGSATPQANVRIRTVAGSPRMQRLLPGGGPIAVFGNQGFAALSTPLDDDTVESITLSAQVFVGGLTPNTGAQAATFATVVMAIGDSDYGRDEADVFGSAASLSWQLNNHVSGTFPSLPIPSPGSRLRVAINNADYDIITTIGGEALLGAPAGSMTYARQAYAPIVVNPGPLVTQGNPAGQLYDVLVTFIKTGPLSTDVEYSIAPSGTPTDAAAITDSDTVTAAAAFPFNAVMDRVVVQMGSAMGFGDAAGTDAPNGAPPGGDGGAFEGSWIDNINVRTFGDIEVAPLAASDWEVFE